MSQPTTPMHKDSELIDLLGGPAEVARKLGFEMPGGTQRVQNWKYRGIPEVLRLRHPGVFQAPDTSEAA